MRMARTRPATASSFKGEAAVRGTTGSLSVTIDQFPTIISGAAPQTSKVRWGGRSSHRAATLSFPDMDCDWIDRV